MIGPFAAFVVALACSGGQEAVPRGTPGSGGSSSGGDQASGGAANAANGGTLIVDADGGLGETITTLAFDPPSATLVLDGTAPARRASSWSRPTRTAIPRWSAPRRRSSIVRISRPWTRAHPSC